MKNITKKSSNKLIFVDYRPAELKINKAWYIEYYVKSPSTDKLVRFRNRVPQIKTKRARELYAKKMIEAINIKLYNGWSPWYENPNNNYKLISDAFELYINKLKKEMSDGIKRPDTLRAYTSFVSNVQRYIDEKQLAIKYLVEIDFRFVSGFLDYIYYEKNNSPATYNNYLAYFKAFLEWAKAKDYIKQNATDNIKNKPKIQKKREPLTQEVKACIKELKNTDFHFFVACMLTYFCLIRRTELTKLKVTDIRLIESRIILDGSITKNRKTDSVTIPDVFLPILAQHLQYAKNSDYLFSTDNFKPGRKQLTPKKISDTWAKYRNLYGFDSKFQFYSLKDTGIMDLLNSGVPSIKVRDQARHYDIKQTESYTTRNLIADDIIRRAKVDF
ncbi:tyrosine-type recombinase/integrase [Capnocytophaga leadbetteri]|jgi:site-specific recombinase, phage integrase family|uniref:tyrosine-type recombinase/integrase n=1 Tax=Capnocytophaga leadbetteri TaxID=327575 RepID=UPI0028EB9991|nr:tyrosine-type recombinase/integrase [Capnocytophaga leadbetteri]